jgi:hypothetical protein
MTDPTDKRAAEVASAHPGWQVWVVHRVYGGNVWCARRQDNHRFVINEDSPENLSAAISEAEGESG